MIPHACTLKQKRWISDKEKKGRKKKDKGTYDLDPGNSTEKSENDNAHGYGIMTNLPPPPLWLTMHGIWVCMTCGLD